MKKVVCALDVEELQFRMKCAVDLVSTVQLAMVDAPVDAASLTDALFGAVNHLRLLLDEMRKLYEAEEDNNHE